MSKDNKAKVFDILAELKAAVPEEHHPAILEVLQKHGLDGPMRLLGYTASHRARWRLGNSGVTNATISNEPMDIGGHGGKLLDALWCRNDIVDTLPNMPVPSVGGSDDS